MTTQYQDRDWLQEKYEEECLTQAEIAERCGVTQPTVSYFVNKFGLEKPARKPHHDESWLREKYVNEQMSMTEIAARCGVTAETISRKIHRSAIKSEGVRGDRNPMYGRPPTNAPVASDRPQ